MTATTKRALYMRGLDRLAPRIEFEEAEAALESWNNWIRSCKALVEDAIDSKGEVELTRSEGEDGNPVWHLVLYRSGRGWKIWRSREVKGMSNALVDAARELCKEVDEVAARAAALAG